MSKTAGEIIDEISFQMFKTDYKYIGLAPCKVMVLEEYINNHASVQLSESIEAYNRECKRVDELTEELEKKQERIQELRIYVTHVRNKSISYYKRIRP